MLISLYILVTYAKGRGHIHVKSDNEHGRRESGEHDVATGAAGRLARAARIQYHEPLHQRVEWRESDRTALHFATLRSLRRCRSAGYSITGQK